ncbi:MAG TPA: FAD-dependent oxidoreductase [Candidatus Limnocylindrales bacterium]|nr:FAD-dependent oxidoreductase [Candidatus Limnocylindrales bacterium]
MATFDFDVVVAGASFGGCAAALAAAADRKVKVVLISLQPDALLGGQATSQGVTRWDETAADLTESAGSSLSYRRLRERIRERYADVRSELGKQQEYFNPGFAGVGPPFTTMDDPPLFRGDQRRGHPFAADPQVVHAALSASLKEAGVTMNTGIAVTAVQVQGQSVHSITVRTASGTDTYTGRVFLDATDLGDLLPLAGVKWVIGAESHDDTNEDDAERVAHPEFIQPFTVPIAVQWVQPDEKNRIPKPDGYDDIRRRQGFDRLKRPANEGGGEGDIHVVFNPNQEEDTLINYRQFIDPRNFSDGRPWRTTLNVGSNDYLTRAIPTNPHSADADAQIVEEARAVSIAYVYYLQNDVPRDDHNGTGYLNVKVDTEAFGRADGTAPGPYIRESRRLANPHTRIVRDDIDAGAHGGGFAVGGRNARPIGVGSKSERATNFTDSCGVGHYNVDVHEGFYSLSGRVEDAAKPNIGTPFHNFETVPFQIPLGALLPKELNNFVAACKNIGTTHLTSGAYRTHPVEWAIGEAAGVLAAYCTTQQVTPGATVSDPNRIAAYQRRVLARGAPIFWWDDVAFGDDEQTFAAVQLLGARGVFSGEDETRNFYPDDDFPQEDRDAIDERLQRELEWPDGPLTRAEAAVLIAEQLGLPV